MALTAPIRWGILGCGDVTEKKSGPAFSIPGRSEVLAVMRRMASLAEDYAQRHQVPRWYSRAGDLIAEETFPLPGSIQAPLIGNVVSAFLGEADLLSSGETARRTNAVIDQISGNR